MGSALCFPCSGQRPAGDGEKEPLASPMDAMFPSAGTSLGSGSYKEAGHGGELLWAVRASQRGVSQKNSPWGHLGGGEVAVCSSGSIPSVGRWVQGTAGCSAGIPKWYLGLVSMGLPTWGCRRWRTPRGSSAGTVAARRTLGPHLQRVRSG